jgi:hypothetical protein
MVKTFARSLGQNPLDTSLKEHLLNNPLPHGLDADPADTYF